jgi:hypothetical protein
MLLDKRQDLLTQRNRFCVRVKRETSFSQKVEYASIKITGFRINCRRNRVAKNSRPTAVKRGWMGRPGNAARMAKIAAPAERPLQMPARVGSKGKSDRLSGGSEASR